MKKLPGASVEFGAACIRSVYDPDRTTVPDQMHYVLNDYKAIFAGYLFT